MDSGCRFASIGGQGFAILAEESTKDQHFLSISRAKADPLFCAAPTFDYSSQACLHLVKMQ